MSSLIWDNFVGAIFIKIMNTHGGGGGGGVGGGADFPPQNLSTPRSTQKMEF